MSTTEFYSDFAMTRKRRTKFMVFVKSNEHNRILFGFCHDEKTKNEVHGFPKVFFKTLYHHRILTELKQISCEATPIRIHGTHGEHGKIIVKDSDVTPKSWTVYLICFDVVSCIVQDSCRA